jgi:hypothetical protein
VQPLDRRDLPAQDLGRLVGATLPVERDRQVVHDPQVLVGERVARQRGAAAPLALTVPRRPVLRVPLVEHVVDHGDPQRRAALDEGHRVGPRQVDLRRQRDRAGEQPERAEDDPDDRDVPDASRARHDARRRPAT